MSISIHSNGVELTNALRTWISDRIGSSVERLGRRGQRVDIYFADQNGPNRGGNDKTCNVVVQVAHQSSLVVKDCDDNIGALVERIADRLALLVDKRTARLNSH